MGIKNFFHACALSVATLSASEAFSQSSERVWFTTNDTGGTIVNFDTLAWRGWLKQVRQQEINAGISREVVIDALPDTLNPIGRVIRLDRKQPDKDMDIDKYLKKIVTTERVDTGLVRLQEFSDLLAQVTEKYPNIEPELIGALWGIETTYGQKTGNFRIVTALATLAFDTRRPDLFREHLHSSLKMLDDFNMSADDFKGSWAGAFGQVQFMPTTYRARAVDFDGDGKRDLWHHHGDIFASAANLMTVNGWKKERSWGCEVTVSKNIDPALFGLGKKYPASFWRDKGIKALDGAPLPDGASFYLVRPDKAKSKRFYLVTDNYKALHRWNPSHYFALSVCEMIDSFKRGKAPQYALPPPSPSP